MTLFLVFLGAWHRQYFIDLVTEIYDYANFKFNQNKYLIVFIRISWEKVYPHPTKKKNGSYFNLCPFNAEN